MEENKTEIVERRLSKGVIRRRARPTPKKEAPAAAAAKPSAPAEEKKPKKAVKKTKETKISKKDEKKFVLSKEEKTKAEKNIQKNVVGDQPQAVEEQVASAEVVQATPKQAQEEAAVVAKQEKPKKEEKPKVLSFKDRIRGHIDLKKTKAPEKEGLSEGRDLEKGQPSKAELLKAEKQKREKLLKTRRGVKTIGGDLDIDGLGRATNLSQIARTSPVDRVFRPSGGGRFGKKKKIVSRKNVKQTAITTKKASKRVIGIDQFITVGNLAQELGVKAKEIIKKLMDLGVMAAINQQIDKDTATLIAQEYEYEVKDVSFKEEEVLTVKEPEEEQQKDAPTRPPVVTIMGHVDHGKTSLLDKIRSTNVVSGEAGGITQHIGAYTVVLNDNKITFLDTPGHEAFTTMRLRGAQSTDIVVLVVAADDGVMPQTEESINHAKAAGVPIIVAVNKIDVPDADPERIKRQLAEKGLVPEDWGGDVIFNNVSAKEGTGLDTLLESILVQSEMLELKSREEGRAKGTVVESRLDRGRGPVCTLLVQEGTLKTGDYVVAGFFAGRVRNLLDWTCKPIKEGTPSTAVELLGLEGVPDAGDSFHVVESEKDARAVIDNRLNEKRKKIGDAQSQVTLEDMFARMKAGEISELSLVIKTDVHGSLEAIKEAVSKIGNEEVTAKFIHTGVGGVNESDVQLAMASKAIIIGFNVRPDTKALHLAKDHHIDVRLYKVIYDLVNDVKLAMQGLLAPDIEEKYLGRAEIRETRSF